MRTIRYDLGADGIATLTLDAPDSPVNTMTAEWQADLATAVGRLEADKERNTGLLKERSWFDIPVIYNNGRRAILAVEKGNPGERAFKDAFAAWGQ